MPVTGHTLFPEMEPAMTEVTTTRPARFAKAWLIFAILGAALAIWSLVATGFSSDTVGYGVAAVGMFVAARSDYTTARWPKFAAPILGLIAIAIWIVW